MHPCVGQFIEPGTINYNKISDLINVVHGIYITVTYKKHIIGKCDEYYINYIVKI